MNKLPLTILSFVLLFALIYKLSDKDGIVEIKNPLEEERIIQWGSYSGGKVEDALNFEEMVGEPVDFLATFIHWGNEKDFPTELGNLAIKEGKTLVIFWEAKDYNKKSPNDPNFSYDSILGGRWDSYIDYFVESVRSYGSPLILVPFEEMNGDWYPWSGTKNNNDATKHKKAYRYLRNKFKSVPNVKFGWVVNSESIPNTTENKIERYYPGDSYVDIVGVNGFNFGSPWLSFSQIFNDSLNVLDRYRKPMIVFSMACAENTLKVDWIKDAAVEIKDNKNISGWIWFNEDKERDWRVWSNDESLKAFKYDLVNLKSD